MERERVKEILKFYHDIEGEIEHREKIIHQWEIRYYEMSGNTNDSFIKSKNKISRPTEATALNIPDSVSEEMFLLRKQIERLTELKIAILREINKLSLPQKRILYDFYISGLKWVQISEKMNYSGTQCKKIRNRGLENLGRFFTENTLIENFSY